MLEYELRSHTGTVSDARTWDKSWWSACLTNRKMTAINFLKCQAKYRQDMMGYKYLSHWPIEKHFSLSIEFCIENNNHNSKPKEVN